MNAGRLDRLIALQRAPVGAQDPDTGQPVLVHAEWLTNVPAQLREMTGIERFAAQQTVGYADCEYVVRDDSDTRTVTNSEIYRLVDGNRLYDIVAVKLSPKRGEHIVFRVRGRAEVAA